MGESDKNEIYLSSSPHAFSRTQTKDLMLSVILSTVPLTLYGIFLFGLSALIRVVLSIAFCACFEAGFRKMLGLKVRIKDNSAIITGLFLALVIPPSLPIWQLILGDFFAIVIGKEVFGGLGSNVFNPALVGRAFLFVSFSKTMTTWTTPRINPFVALSSATPLSMIKPDGQPFMGVKTLAGAFGLSVEGLYTHLFLGNHAGCIGETSTLLILLGGLYLIWRGVIDWKIPLSMIFVAVGITWLGGVNPILTLTTGGLCFGAFFMATDYVTSPVTGKGRLLFGAGCGLITALLRLFSSLPEGVMFSILIMNATVPFLNKLVRRKYGYVKPKKEAKK